MCGIALIISGVRIDLSLLLPDYRLPPETDEVDQPELSVDHLKAALLRRGPDNLGCKKILLQLKSSSSVEELSHLDVGKVIKRERSCLCFSEKNNVCIVSASEVSWTQDSHVTAMKSVAELHFLGATLQLRGINPVFQPLVDTSSNVLVYNGEIFGGIEVGSDSNDSEVLMDALGSCCSCDFHTSERKCCSTGKALSSVPELLSTIKGPWALIYWQDSSKTMWFGRDAFGRRSLLVHWPTLDDFRLLLSSVSPLSFIKNDTDRGLNFWEELPCGIYSICFDASKASGFLVGTARKHEWTDPGLQELIKWDRAFVKPQAEELKFGNLAVVEQQSLINSTSLEGMPSELCSHHIIEQAKLNTGIIQHSVSLPAFKVLIALKESVMRRTAENRIFQRTIPEIRKENLAQVAILFSGGLDSMILAALLDKCVDPIYKIDLLNVSFDGQSAPDRISARAGLKELQRNAPLRRWNLVEIDADLSDLSSEIKCVMSLISPANTYMDLNIGIALWLAASGDGWLVEGISSNHEEDHRRIKYKSEAKILLVGSGADEQCAGYGRHKTKYRLSGWLGLHEEMRLDMQRIWKRNLGRDDRCISDNGKEARFPFLDEDVIRTLLDMPLWEIAELDQPMGRGDKKILREVAWLLGLEEVSSLPKRAIQFGSRIARESNRKNFGSNRAANQASAGSVVIHRPTGAT
ncbi:asparagine synthetase domain-containing protein 1 isoform X2 [Telopea speciosissima]|uniref:asparagine synthetase domain-containing protein 1 isoform X2 n=1 Tax=Telopea speciosissima TaxID=54955 RepID=UPI001CC4F234|nr:asparagine synthetase domain-containing protein 1 isoform X2 [Telopea speciosissima]